MTVDTLMLGLNQVRDDESLPEASRLEAEHIAAELQQGVVSEDVFIREASRFLGLARVDEAGAFNRTFALHAPRGPSSKEVVAFDRFLDATAPYGPENRDLAYRLTEKFVGGLPS